MICFNEEQFLNADSLRIFNDEGTAISVNDEQPWNANCLIIEILDGIVICESDEHS